MNKTKNPASVPCSGKSSDLISLTFSYANIFNYLSAYFHRKSKEMQTLFEGLSCQKEMEDPSLRE